MDRQHKRADEFANARTGSSWRGLWQRGLFASLFAAAVNACLYIAAAIFGVFPSLHLFGAASPQPALVTVVIVSSAAALASTGLYRVFAKRMEHPLLLLGGLATLVLLVSFLPPTARSDWSRAQLVMIELMHITVATSIVTALWGWQRTTNRERVA